MMKHLPAKPVHANSFTRIPFSRTMLIGFLLLCALIKGTAQTFTITTTATTTTLFSTTGGAMVFGFNNTNSYPVTIKNISTYCGASITATYTLWYHPTALSGAPSAITTANGWIQLSPSGTVTSPATAGIISAISNLSLLVPANTTYRLALQVSNNGPYSANLGGGANFFTANGIEIYTQNHPVSPTYTGPFPGPPTTTPRGFYGSITYEVARTGGNNASVSALVAPLSFCSSAQDVKVRIKNKGKNVISHVNVEWELDGTGQSPVIFNFPLDTIGGSGVNDTVVTLGNVSFLPNAPRTIRAWTNLPNSTADTVNNDDTLYATLRTAFSGSYTIGNFSADYASVSAAVKDLNKFGVCGPTTFNVAAGSTFTEDPIAVTQSGTAANPIIFQKSGAGANPVIYSKNGIGSSDAGVTLYGCNYVTFDGIDITDSSSNATGITQLEYGYLLSNSSAVAGAGNNVIRNGKVILKRSNTATIGLLQFTAYTATALSGGNHNNRYENVKVENSYNGILLSGTAAFPDSNNVITSSGSDSTIIGAVTASDIGGGSAISTGIQVVEQKNVEISKCTVRNLFITGATIPSGIWVNNVSTVVDYGKARVFNNTIFNLARTGTGTVGSISGIKVDISPNATATVYNNVIYGITTGNPTSASATVVVRGISHGIATGTGNAEYYHNSINLNLSTPNSTSAAFWKAGTGTATVKNNIFSNVSPAQSGVAKHYASYISAGSITSSHNILWAPNTNGVPGFITIDRTTLAQFAAASSPAAPADGNERGSAAVDPGFTSSTDLSFSAATAASGSGTTIAGQPITIDIMGNARAAKPAIGAFETGQLQRDSSAPVIGNVIINNSVTPSIYATVTDNSSAANAGDMRLWYRTGTSGVFTSVLADSLPSGSISGTYKWDASLSALTAGVYQFYITIRDLSGPGLNIAVNPVQNTAFTSFSAADPVNFATNPDAGANTRSFTKIGIITAGTYTVGATGMYQKLTNVVNTLNVSQLTGNVVFELLNDYDGTTGETFPITFSQVSTSGGNWTVTIRPDINATGLVITSANTTATIDMNGAKRILFDGRPNGTGSVKQLAITNTSSAGATIRLINDAQDNAFSYLDLKGSNTTATSGVVLFSTANGTGSANGNSNNTIDHCNINGNSASVNCIYTSGTAAPADNKNNTITNCNIYDFFSNVASTNICGINMALNSSGWNIGTAGNGNNFYQTAARTPSTVPALTNIGFFKAVFLNDASITGCSIVGNRIGGNIPGIPASTFVIGNSTTNVGHTLRPIDVTASGTTAPISIQGNTVSDMTIYSTVTNLFIGLHGSTGWVNTGNITGNTVGSSTGTGSINLFYTGTTAGANGYGIRYGGASGLIQNNTVGSITAETQNTGSFQLLGIYLTGTYTTPVIVSNNAVGSATTAHSLQSTAASTTGINVMGFVASSASGVQVTFSNNTVTNLSSLCPLGLSNNAVKGFYITGTSTVGTTVSGNTISQLYSASTNTAADQTGAIVGISNVNASGIQVISNNTLHTFTSNVTSSTGVNLIGIYYGSTTTAPVNRIEANVIRSFGTTSTNALAVQTGISVGAGTTRVVVANNMIRLGLDGTGAPVTGAAAITGILKTGGVASCFYNTVAIGGTGVTTTTNNTFGYKTTTSSIDSLVNNIFVNTRTNATTGGTHYAISLPNAVNLVTDYNLYYTTGAPLGLFNSVSQAALADWRAATTQDAGSASKNVNFSSATDLHLATGSIGDYSLKGTPVTGLTTDMDGQARNVSFPYMGADENLASPLPVELIALAATRLKNDVMLDWSTASENGSAYFDVERSAEGRSFERVGMVKAAGNALAITSYRFADAGAFLSNNPAWYYRLRMVDRDGKTSYSQMVSVSNNKKAAGAAVSVFPNPFSDNIQLSFSDEVSGQVSYELLDLAGKLVSGGEATISQEHTVTIDRLSRLKKGIYFIRVHAGEEITTVKIIRD